MTGIFLRDSSESGIAAGIGRMGHKNGSSNRSRMKKLWMLLLAAICGSCSIPPEDENRHYSIWIANNSQNAILADFCRSFYSNPSAGAVNYAKLKRKNDPFGSAETCLVLPGEKNYSACDIGSFDGYSTIEYDMSDCDWILYVVDPVIINMYSLEELNGTEIGVLAKRRFSLREVKDRNFAITYPDDFEQIGNCNGPLYVGAGGRHAHSRNPWARSCISPPSGVTRKQPLDSGVM